MLKDTTSDPWILLNIRTIEKEKRQNTQELTEKLNTTRVKIIRGRAILKYGSKPLIDSVLSGGISIHAAYLSLDNIPKRKSKRFPPYSVVSSLVRIDSNSPTGLSWVRHRPEHGCHSGAPAGCLLKEGYVIISLNCNSHVGSRVVWMLLHGDWPPEGMFVQYRDGNILNNSIENVTLVTRQQMYRRRPRGKGYSKIKGWFVVQLQNPHTNDVEEFGKYATEAQAKKRVSTIRNMFKKLYPECY